MSSNEMSIEGSENSLNGLQFGQKMYFEEVGIGVCGKRGNGSKRNGQNVLKTKCQVEGCKIDLSDAKAYYLRHKVCGMHSKSPLVIVKGIEQRFCQQCSRFHKLPEFDQGKRSCRRRLAGHNERRRKPTPGSLLSSRLGHLSSSLFSGSTSRGGFLLDFTSYSKHSERDSWPSSKTSEGLSGSQLTSLGKFQHNLWPGNSEGHPSQMHLQGSSGDTTSYSIPSGEFITGVATDSSCALSLLSNETWGCRSGPSGTDLGNLMNLGAPPMSKCTSTHTVTVAQLPGNNSSWSFRGASSAHVGLGQIPHPLNGQLHSDLFMDQTHDGRHYMEVDRSGGYGPSVASHVDWSI